MSLSGENKEVNFISRVYYFAFQNNDSKLHGCTYSKIEIKIDWILFTYAGELSCCVNSNARSTEPKLDREASLNNIFLYYILI